MLFQRTLVSISLGLLLAAIASSGGFVMSGHFGQKAYAATSSTINFQARLEGTGGNIASDGYYNIEFKLYSASSGGSALWTEDYYDSNGPAAGNDNRVQVINGYVTVNLGSQTAFPGTIDWSQQTWVTMNVGGTAQVASPTYDGEMNPRLQLTAVPYAFNAGKLGGLDSSGFIQNTTSPQTANFNVTGNGIAGSLQAASLDSPATGTLNIAGSNATTVNIANNDATHTINIGAGATGTNSQSITIGSEIGAGYTRIKGGAGGVGLYTTAGGSLTSSIGGNLVSTIDSNGKVSFKPISNSSNSFSVQTAGGLDVLTVNTSAGVVGTCANCGVYVGRNGLNLDGALVVNNGSAYTDYITPLGANLASKISIVNDPISGYNTLFALGVTSSSSANGRAIVVADARTVAHQPSVAVLSPDENNIGGFSYNGSNTNFTVQTSTAGIMLQNSGGAGFKLSYSSGAATQTAEVGTGSSTTGILQFNNASGANSTSLQASGVSTSYISNLPAAIGTAGQCLSVASVSGSTQQIGYATCSGSGGSTGVTLQASTPGTADTGNFNISGVGIASTFYANDFGRATAGTLTFGNMNASTINIGSNALAHTVNVATDTTTAQTLNLGSSFGASSVLIRSGSGGVTIGAGTSTTATVNANLVNNGSTLNTIMALANFAAGADIGTAATTVDVRTSFTINQTTAGISLTVPSPTNTAAGRVIYVTNIGSASFNLIGSPLAPNASATLVWSGTVWTFSGADANSILNQTATSQTAGFSISGKGTLGQLQVTTTAAGNVGAVLKGAASQTGDLLQAQDSNGVILSGITSGGAIFTNGAKNVINGLDSPVVSTSSTGSTYYYAVTAYNNSGAESGYTTALGMASSSVTLTWAQVAGATGYKVYRNTSSSYVYNGSYLVGTISSGSTTSFTDANFTMTAGAPPTGVTNTLLRIGTTTGQTYSTGGTCTNNVFAVGYNGGNSLTVDCNANVIVQSSLAVNSAFSLKASSAGFTNSTFTLNSTLALGNFAASGAIGTAAATVDARTSFTVTQTTAGISLTIPSPTTTTAGRLIYIINNGTVPFTLAGSSLMAGGTAALTWNNSAWSYTGTNGIMNQTAVQQTGSFNIDGSGTLGQLTATGNSLFKAATNSTTAFQIQNSTASSTLFTADTVNNQIKVTNLVVGIHIISAGGAPTIAAGPAACTSPTVSISGTDTAGLITVTSGSSCSAGGKLATISFNTAFTAAPNVTITPATSTSAPLNSYINSATTATGSYELTTLASDTIANATTYKWYYTVIQ